MIKSYNKPRLKDSLYIKMPKRKANDPEPGRCKSCRQPMVILHDFSSHGHLAVCQNGLCDAYAQPQAYLMYKRFADSDS